MSRQKPVTYQDQIQIPPANSRVATSPVDQKLNMSDQQSRVQIQQQLQDPGYLLQQQFDQPQQQTQPQQQQQFIHGTHYIHHHTPAGAVPIPAYYPVYPPQQQPHPQQHPQLDQQYQVYYVPARQAQAYNLSVQQHQPNMNEPTTTIPSSRPQAPPNPAIVQPSVAYNPMRNAPPPPPKSELTAGTYRTAAGGNPQLVQVPSTQHQHQQQYVAYPQIPHQSHSVAPASAAPANYAYEYAADPAHAQIYYTQPLPPTMPSQSIRP